MTNEMISKVSEELKAQGINATSAQIESAVKEVMSKQELTEDALDNVAGGFNPALLITLVPTAIDVIKKVTGGGDKKEEKKDGGKDSGDKINLNQPNNNNKSNQLTNVEGANTQTTNNFNFN